MESINLEMPLVITESLITSIEKLKMVVNSFDSGDILVKNDSTTLFHTSYKDDGFGQFFYDNYVSTTKMPAAIKDPRAGDIVASLCMSSLLRKMVSTASTF